jgi:hypothetical protein
LLDRQPTSSRVLHQRSGGNVSPDFVGNIRVDQAAFTAQVSAGLHNIHAGYYGTTEPTGHPR